MNSFAKQPTKKSPPFQSSACAAVKNGEFYVYAVLINAWIETVKQFIGFHSFRKSVYEDKSVERVYGDTGK
jgi:hypothetical protein